MLKIVKDFSNYIKNSENIRCDFYLSKKIIDIVCDIDNMYLTSPKTIVDDLDNIDYDEIIIGTAHRYFNIFNKIDKKNIKLLLLFIILIFQRQRNGNYLKMFLKMNRNTD